MEIGIDAISCYTPRYALALADLAQARGVAPAKYLTGIGQERFSVTPPSEDAVTMAANAAAPLLGECDPRRLAAIIVGTESGVDASKASAVFVHHLLSLPASCPAFEVKQACYGATAALQMALPMIAAQPDKAVLLIASDVARYEIGSAGEPTQGAGAVAMLIRARPRLLAIEAPWGCHVEDVMDFWRPPYLESALVDGKLSIRVYLETLEAAFARYQANGGSAFAALDRCCYHLPFARMAEKAHRHLSAAHQILAEPARYLDSLTYARQVGNAYTASLYLALASLLETAPEPLTGARIGCFSYGSGAVGAFFSARVVAGYQAHLRVAAHQALLADRTLLSVAEYETMWQQRLPTDGSQLLLPPDRTGPFRLAGVSGHRRMYEAAPPPEATLPDLSQAELPEAETEPSQPARRTLRH